MGEGGRTAYFCVQSTVQMFRQGKPQESIGWLPAPSRSASCSRGGGVLEQTTHFCVAPTEGRAFGEEHCFEGGKALLTSHFEEVTRVLSSNDVCGMGHSNPKGWPDSAWPGWEKIHMETIAFREWNSFNSAMLAPHYSLFLKAKKALISQLAPFPIQICRLCYKKRNAPSPTALSSAGDIHEKKTGGIVI
ncbi:hypothetical protein G4B88_000651 [Cannabis sativa]|uniref:Uncharacterized protein n=1 Tax=Cannabis sativa TaxID=3483 RepID=A0A7J6HI95_CANSA|nr:hypothetical protein G4B88_000651 [Cannabis sativa]